MHFCQRVEDNAFHLAIVAFGIARARHSELDCTPLTDADAALGVPLVSDSAWAWE